MRISDWSSDVCSSDLDVAEAARFAVAVVVDRPGLRLGAVVVGQFEHAALARQPLAAILVAVGHVVQFGQHEEVQRELRLLEIHLACQRETEHAGVEVQRRLRVPDPQHGVVEHETGGGGVADRCDTGYGGKIVAGLGGHVENSWCGQRIIAARSSRRCCDGSFSLRPRGVGGVARTYDCFCSDSSASTAASATYAPPHCPLTTAGRPRTPTGA